MNLPPAVIEKMALAYEQFGEWDAQTSVGPMHVNAMGDALAVLDSEGFVVVPREPTEEMLKAGHEEAVNNGDHFDGYEEGDWMPKLTPQVYRAMLAAWEAENA